MKSTLVSHFVCRFKDASLHLAYDQALALDQKQTSALDEGGDMNPYMQPDVVSTASAAPRPFRVHSDGGGSTSGGGAGSGGASAGTSGASTGRSDGACDFTPMWTSRGAVDSVYYARYLTSKQEEERAKGSSDSATAGGMQYGSCMRALKLKDPTKKDSDQQSNHMPETEAGESDIDYKSMQGP